MHKSIYILILACSFFFNAKAQEKNELNIDSTVESVTSKYDTSTEPGESLSVDSTLTPNQLTITADSVESWKNMSAFAYAKYLDSLLKIKQAAPKANNPKTSRSSSRSSSSSSSTPESSDQGAPTWFDRMFTSPITSIVLWTLAAIFIAFVLYKLFLGGGSPFKKKTRSMPQATQDLVEEELSSESDFDAMIRQAVGKGNYRLAIRYQYLRSLHRLADKHFIEMAADKTNYQYVRELAGRGPAVNQQFQNDFASLTLNYEYVWYGEFSVDDVIYNRIARGFNDFNQKI